MIFRPYSCHRFLKTHDSHGIDVIYRDCTMFYPWLLICVTLPALTSDWRAGKRNVADVRPNEQVLARNFVNDFNGRMAMGIPPSDGAAAE